MTPLQIFTECSYLLGGDESNGLEIDYSVGWYLTKEGLEGWPVPIFSLNSPTVKGGGEILVSAVFDAVYFRWRHSLW